MKLGKHYIRGETSGYRGWRPLRQITGQDESGNPESVQVFRNILTGEIHRDWGKGWNGSPPYPTGELNMHTSDAFRKNYDLIRWDK